MAREKICGIYKVTNQVNGKVYIGQSRDILDRWRAHKFDAFYEKAPDYDCIFHQAIRKYGIQSFIFELLEKCPPEILNEREKFYIESYKTYSNNHQFGYNMTPGGDKAFNFASNIKQPDYIPCPICGEFMWKTSKCCIKCMKQFYSISVQDKRINGLLIIPPSKEELLKSIYENKTNQLVADYYKISTVLLSKWKVKLGIPKSKKDAIILYEREYLHLPPREEKFKKPYKRVVLQMSLETGEVLNEFESCSAAERFLGIKNGGGVNNCCLGKIKKSYGYFWKYKE